METDVATGHTLEHRIAEWRAFLARRRAIGADAADELEDHLRDEIAALSDAGLDDDEAFLVAVRRLGDLDSLSREYALEYSERLWKQLVVPGDSTTGETDTSRREAIVAVCLGIAAAAAVKLPQAFGLEFFGPDAANGFYARNFSLFALPFLAAYFAWKRGLDRARCAWLALLFALAALVVNLLPFEPHGHTQVLAALHLPIALWLAVGFAYTRGRWREHAKRMDFVRFSGEWFIYYSLIALGGMVLMMFTSFVFSSISIDVVPLLQSWVLPCGVVGAVLVAAWLVEAKQSLIENMAPVLTRLFTPLLIVVLVTFLVTMLWTGRGIDIEREVLIGFDLLLVLVIGLVVYSISARDPEAAPGAFDLLELVLIVAALLVDLLALSAIAARISEFGFSPNKVAALGENLILLANLGGSALLSMRFLASRGSFDRLERWQTAFLPVYAAWAWIVVAIFPVLFSYR